MKKVPYRDQISKYFGIYLVVLLLLSTSLSAQDEAQTQEVATQEAATQEAAASGDATAAGDAVKGKQLFNQNCAACHDLNRKMTGPALANVETRLSELGLDKEWIHSWIKNSPAKIASGDAYANKIYNEYNQAAMTPFPTLSDEDIDNILAYTAAPPATPPPVTEAGGGTAGGTTSDSGISNETC
jgi:mono/diheme cytochrome c family protein